MLIDSASGAAIVKDGQVTLPRRAVVDDDGLALQQSLLNVFCGEGSNEAKGLKAAEVVTAAALKRGRMFYHAECRDFSTAMYFDRGTKSLLRLRSDEFQSWLSSWCGVNRASKFWKYITTRLENESLSGAGTTGIVPEQFWAARKSAVYLSCGQGHVAKVTATGVTMEDNGVDGVLFEGKKVCATWRLLDGPGADPIEACSIFRDIHAEADHGKMLFRLWLFGLPCCTATKPVLGNIGEIGSGKTRLAKAAAELYGVPWVAASVDDSAEAERNFWVNCDNGGLYILDNVDSKVKWLPDAIAAAATDGGKPVRRLYTTNDVVTMRARAWCVITSAQPSFASDAGLADRMLVLRMNRHGTETEDGQLSAEIEGARDAGLTFICRTLSKALATRAQKENLNFRHPDWATLAVRIAKALDMEDAGRHAIKAAERDKSQFCIANDAVGSAVLALVEKEGRWEGDGAALAEALGQVDEALQHDPWRINAKKAGRWVARVLPHLKQVVDATIEDNKSTNTKYYRLGRKYEESPF